LIRGRIDGGVRRRDPEEEGMVVVVDIEGRKAGRRGRRSSGEKERSRPVGERRELDLFSSESC
jgi:hypothetical protein